MDKEGAAGEGRREEEKRTEAWRREAEVGKGRQEKVTEQVTEKKGSESGQEQ